MNEFFELAKFLAFCLAVAAAYKLFEWILGKLDGDR
jgi:uncharacterized membrane protein YjdF